MAGEADNNPKYTVILAIIIVAVVAVLLLVKSPGEQLGTTGEPFERYDIDVENTEATERIPNGFAKDIPLNPAEIIEAYTLTEPDAVYHVVTYSTDATLEEEHEKFIDYMDSSTYGMMANEEVEGGVFLRGIRRVEVSGGNELHDLSLVMTRNEDLSIVTATYKITEIPPLQE